MALKRKAYSQSTELLCTLGPSSMNDRIIERLEELNVSLFRINLSHTKLSDVADAIRFIRQRTNVPLCLDSEGAQIRTGDFVEPNISVRENGIIRAHVRRVPGDSKDINFYPLDIIRRFQIGDFISIDFNSVLVQVIDEHDDFVTMRVLTGGIIGRNKAVTVERDLSMPPLTEKDQAALQIGVKEGVKHFALSFANRGGDVDTIRKIVGDSFVISKIECINGLKNQEEIMQKSDALLIDRGDLSRQIPIERIPRTQKEIIRKCKDSGIKVYVATNLLESMIDAPIPTRAEVNDIYNTLNDGADGLVLAAETAIGEFPIHCASMIIKMIEDFEENGTKDQAPYFDDPISLLVPPHGGQLVHREATNDDLKNIDSLPSLSVSDTDLIDCEQIAFGTFSPITGFMDRNTLEAVLDHNRLPNGETWTMPLVLQIGSADAKALPRHGRISLKDESGIIRALMDVSEVFELDPETLTDRWFETRSADHPGVTKLIQGGSTFIAGDITMVERLPSPYRHYELTPSQTRFIFAHKGWNRIVAFHTRNPAHRAHEFIQKQALERSRADGLYISPVIGPRKAWDFLPDPVMKSYQLLLEFGCYPKGKVVLGSFPTYPRYAGPREAVFTALCRKNMGCSHFVIGRDHTGVGDFYAPDANRKLFDALGDVGIAPVFFDTVGYDSKKELYVEDNRGDGLELISGTEVRNTLRDGKPLPDWFMRDIVQDMLRQEIASGNEVFSK